MNSAVDGPDLVDALAFSDSTSVGIWISVVPDSVAGCGVGCGALA